MAATNLSLDNQLEVMYAACRDLRDLAYETYGLPQVPVECGSSVKVSFTTRIMADQPEGLTADLESSGASGGFDVKVHDVRPDRTFDWVGFVAFGGHALRLPTTERYDPHMNPADRITFDRGWHKWWYGTDSWHPPEARTDILQGVNNRLIGLFRNPAMGVRLEFCSAWTNDNRQSAVFSSRVEEVVRRQHKALLPSQA